MERLDHLVVPLIADIDGRIGLFIEFAPLRKDLVDPVLPVFPPEQGPPPLASLQA